MLNNSSLQNDLICLSKTHTKDLRGKWFYDKAFVLCFNSRLVGFDKTIVKQAKDTTNDDKRLT